MAKSKPETRRQLQPDMYWKLTTLLARRENFREQAQAQLNAISGEIATAMTAAGLDPSRVYRFNDADTSATPKAPE